MNAALPPEPLEKLEREISNTRPQPGHGELVQVLSTVFPDRDWELVSSRKGWHRVGGIVDAQGNRISDNLLAWIEQEGADDLMDLFIRYEDDGLLATKMCGTTHYLTAKTGDDPWDFIQVEVNELREITDRELFDPENPPDAVEDLLSPDEPVKVDPTSLGAAIYELRQTWDIADAYKNMSEGSYGGSLFTLRFFDDWLASSAATRKFHRRFVLKMSIFKDRFGERRLQATPVSTAKQGLPPLPSATERGVDLHNFLQAFDRAVGYPMAWYFCMITGVDKGLEAIAHAVYEDVTGPYDYLPERDVNVLKGWIEDNYAF